MDYDMGANESVSMAVVRAVSAVDGTDPCSLPPLANRLDPDALDAIFEPGLEGIPRRGDHLSFNYAEYRVTIDDGEHLTVRPMDRGIGGHDTDQSSL